LKGERLLPVGRARQGLPPPGTPGTGRLLHPGADSPCKPGHPERPLRLVDYPLIRKGG
jgi:hypothetical protein